MPALWISAAVEGFNFAHFGSQLHPYILNNLNKSGGHSASAILSLSLVHWAVGPSPGGELDPEAHQSQAMGRVRRMLWCSRECWHTWAPWQKVS